MVIFPFINEMILATGMVEDPKEVGYYSGVIEGLFAMSQFCTVYWWGRLSDRIGRRPVLLMGITGAGLCTGIFGFTTTFWQMVLLRCLAGGLSGNSAVIKSVFGEITDRTNEGIAFPLIPLCWSIGTVIAPVIGGFLSRPAENFPKFFGHIQLFRDYPYALPCLGASGFCIIGFTFGSLFLNETLPSKARSNTQDQSAEAGLSNSMSTPNYGATSSVAGSSLNATTAQSKRDRSLRHLFQFPAVRAVIIAYIFLALVAVSVEAVLVLWLYTPVDGGGIEFSVQEIGSILAVGGIISTFLNIVVFPPLQRRIGTLPIYRFAMAMFPFLIILFPTIHFIATSSNHELTKYCVLFMIVFRSIAGLVFTGNMILVNASAPSRDYLGAVNGAAQMVVSLMRAIGPTVSTVLFALSMSKGYLGGNLIWGIMLSVSIFAVIASRRVTDPREEE
jgi:MFS family permease